MLPDFELVVLFHQAIRMQHIRHHFHRDLSIFPASNIRQPVERDQVQVGTCIGVAWIPVLCDVISAVARVHGQWSAML
jgi:hypothetical protein